MPIRFVRESARLGLKGTEATEAADSLSRACRLTRRTSRRLSGCCWRSRQP